MKTKIIATVGPKTYLVQKVKEMIIAGATVFRTNISHGEIKWHRDAIKNAQKAGIELGIKIKTVIDTKGPEIRTGVMQGELKLKKGDKLELRSKSGELGKKDGSPAVSVSHSLLYKNPALKKGKIISLDSGKITLTIDRIEGTSIHTTVQNDGILTSKRHVNVPGVRINLPILTEGDKAAIKMGAQVGADFLAVSFVRDKDDILEVRKEIKRHTKKGQRQMKIISKIEHFEALKNLEDIVSLSDEVMVARGDLGIEMPFYQVPLLEERIIKVCKKYKKPVIVATQMLISMTKNTIPTRAEAMDVALAVQFGANAVMLSDETASGKYPIKAIEAMKSIVKYTEENGNKISF